MGGANFIEVALACKDANSKPVEDVSVVDVDEEDHIGKSLLLIQVLRFGKLNSTLGSVVLLAMFGQWLPLRCHGK